MKEEITREKRRSRRETKKERMKKKIIMYYGRLRMYMLFPVYLTILLAAAAVGMFFVDIRAGVVMALITGIYLLVAVLLYRGLKPRILREMVNIVTQYGTVQNKLLKELLVPYALVDNTGRVLWTNEAFVNMTGIEGSVNSFIDKYFPQISRERLKLSDDVKDLRIEWNSRVLRATMKKIGFNSVLGENALIKEIEGEDTLTALYLFDETELNIYRTANEEQKLVVAQVYIDNYDEALDSVEDVKRSMLTALVDRRVTNYFAKVDALIRKVESDKYFVIFRNKYLKTLQEDKFSVLEDVKGVKVGNAMTVTLSIGIGLGADSYLQNNELSRAAIDLALGRGGDQVVVRDGEKISYFGGNSEHVEKSTRVKARVKALALRSILESHERVIIMGHKISDADAFGSAVGIFVAAREVEKEAHIVLNTVTASLSPLVEMFNPENGYPADMIIGSEQAIQICDSDTVVVVVDTNIVSRTECPEVLQKTRELVVFDHHRQSSDVIRNPLLSYVEPFASSACEMVAEVLQYYSERVRLEPEEADAMYAGIVQDTQNFSAKTGVRTFEAAAYLKRSGADSNRVRKLLRENLESYAAVAGIVKSAEIYRGKFAISVNEEAQFQKDPTVLAARAANDLLDVKGMVASFVLTPFGGKIHISARAIDEMNVQVLMEKLGGGGHLNIAGAQLADTTIDEALEMVHKVLDDAEE